MVAVDGCVRSFDGFDGVDGVDDVGTMWVVGGGRRH